MLLVIAARRPRCLAITRAALRAADVWIAALHTRRRAAADSPAQGSEQQTQIAAQPPDEPPTNTTRCKASSSSTERNRATVTIERQLLIAHIPIGHNGSVDTVVSTFVLCTVDAPELALREIARVLRADGQLLFIEHVRSDSPTLAYWQDRLVGPWRRLRKAVAATARPRS
jgi:SAM-dependent methyltransferase